MQISINIIEQICNYLNVVNEFFRAPIFEERSRPDRSGGFGGGEQLARLPYEVRGDASVKRRTHSGLGTSTPNMPRIPAPPAKINNKIKTFADTDKTFLTIFSDHLSADECCEPRR